MIWRSPREKLPEKGKMVCVLYQHGKQHKYMSTEMMCGEVEFSANFESCFVCSGDFTGKGSWGIYLLNKHGDYYGETPLAWCYAEEFEWPTWDPHDPHWAVLNGSWQHEHTNSPDLNLAPKSGSNLDKSSK